MQVTHCDHCAAEIRQMGNTLWDSWAELRHTIETLVTEESILPATAEKMFNALMDFKQIAMESEEKEMKNGDT